MAYPTDLATPRLEDEAQMRKPASALRFVVFGQADGGGTLIERLLRDGGLCAQDDEPAGGQAAAHGPHDTPDAARRFVSSARRSLIACELPGPGPLTPGLVAAASRAEVAVILVDAPKGLAPQARHHSHLARQLGIRKAVLAIDRMDLVGHSEGAYRRIVDEHRDFAGRIGLAQIAAIPLSSRAGDNVAQPGAHTPWYRGPTMLGCLEAIETETPRRPLRLPVERVEPMAQPAGQRPGLVGTLASGEVKPGERIRVQPSGRESTVAHIVDASGELPLATAGQSVTLVLADAIDVAPGDLVSTAAHPAEVADQFSATLVWLAAEPMYPGRPYALKIGGHRLEATVTDLKHRVDLPTLEHLAAKKLEADEIGEVNLSLARAIAFDPYETSPETGGFALVDRTSGATVGAGMLRFALRRAHNIHLQPTDIDKSARAGLKGQRPAVVWLTGLSGAGKSTIANLVEKKLHALGRHSYLLDGDNVRHGLNRDLGFTEADRVENIRRIAEVAKLMVDAGLIVVTAFISPFRAERDMARRLVAAGEFIEVHVDIPLALAEQRDVKGLYKKARRGELKNFTGIDSPYEPPEAPELRLDTAHCTPEQAAEQVIAALREHGLLG